MIRIGNLRRHRVTATLFALLLLIFLFSPLLLVLVGNVSERSWTHLSDVGQAYGFGAALLSAAALLAVASSLRLQTEMNRASKSQTFRGMQAIILQVAASEPDVYMPCYGMDSPEDIIRWKRSLFCALRARYWLSGFEVGEIGEFELRTELAPEIYGNDFSLGWWLEVSPLWHGIGTKHRVRMAQILDEEVERNVIASNEGMSSTRFADRYVHPSLQHKPRQSNPTPPRTDE